MDQLRQLGGSVSRADGIAVQAVHQARIMAAIPAYVQGKEEPTGAGQIADQDRCAGLGDASDFSQKSGRMLQMMEDRVAADEVETVAGEWQ